MGAGGQPRSTEALPAPGAEHGAAAPDPVVGVDSAPATSASVTLGIREGELELDHLSSPPSPASVRPVADVGSPAASDLVGQPRPAGLPAGTLEVPRMAAPDPTAPPPASSDRGPSVGSPYPPPDPRAGLAETSSAAGEPGAQPPETAATRSADTSAAHAGPAIQHGDVERIAAGQTRGSIAEPPTKPIAPESAVAGQAGRLSTNAHLIDRGEGARAESGRPADPLTTRRDPARPSSTRDDTNRPAGARPGRPRRSNVAHDMPEDLQPATVTRAPDPLAAGKDGIIKANHDDNHPNPGEPESHQGGLDDHNTSHPGTAGGGPGNDRGAASDYDRGQAAIAMSQPTAAVAAAVDGGWVTVALLAIPQTEAAVTRASRSAATKNRCQGQTHRKSHRPICPPSWGLVNHTKG